MDFYDPETKELLGEHEKFLPTGGPPPMFICGDKTKHLFEQIERAAHSDLSVLLQGESGVGKEHFAAAVHYLGERKDGPLINVNCACLPGELVESELFGHKKGAFTGATENKDGIFKLANKGTLFLDEISVLPEALQAKLLRALQENKIRPVGGVETTWIDVRFVASTNQNLAALVAKNRFRQDLFYRLNTLTFIIPPLRERPEEILPLARYFVVTAGRGLGHKQFSPEAKEALLTYSWPGNVRELKHVVEAALLMGEEEEIMPQDLRFTPLPHLAAKNLTEEYDLTLAGAVEKHILAVLENYGGDKDKTADSLRISRKTLQRYLKKYRIS